MSGSLRGPPPISLRWRRFERARRGDDRNAAARARARAASIDALERELARLRRAAVAHARERGQALARASVLNLVVYAEREIHARRAARAVADLALRHPSRAIIVLGDRRRDGVLASLQLHCHVPRSDGAQPVLYEQILARVRGDFDERVASVVIPLLVPDLPVFLWWTGTPPSDGRHVDDLVTLADRLIVDSADFARADLTLPEVARLARFGFSSVAGASGARRVSATGRSFTVM